ncbi:NUDIX domain-containing protein [Streptomyces sp. NPDC093589]|uniref:NUDIX domain-containing protein n=1 Tax=Streptomyces sp. NPDC093589 TaxID=3366043 RepID=UPI003830DDEA
MPAVRPFDMLTGRQPMVAVAVIVIAAPGLLLVTDPNRRGYIELPGSLTHDYETPEAAVERVVRDRLGLALPAGQLVGIDRVEHPNRSVVTHIFATGPLTRRQISTLRLHNTQGTVRILSTVNALPLLPPRSRARADAGLKALTARTVAHLGTGATPPNSRSSTRSGKSKGAPAATQAAAASQPTVLVTSSAVITDRQDRLLIVRDDSSEAWSLPGGAPETSVGETPRETAERYTLQGLGRLIPLEQLLGIDWCHHPSRPAHVHYFYGAETPGSLRIDSVPCPQGGASEAKFIAPAAASAFLSSQDTRRVHACLTARKTETGALELHDDHARSRLPLRLPAADRSSTA